MDLNITEFFNTAEPFNYSASVAEMGNNAGRITWNNAVDDSKVFNLLDTDEKREAFKRFISGFGAWTEEEVNAWSNDELNALCIQFISGDMREAGLHADMTVDEWLEYEKECERGTYSSRIYGGPLCVDAFKDQVFFSLD